VRESGLESVAFEQEKPPALRFADLVSGYGALPTQRAFAVLDLLVLQPSWKLHRYLARIPWAVRCRQSKGFVVLAEYVQYMHIKNIQN